MQGQRETNITGGIKMGIVFVDEDRKSKFRIAEEVQEIAARLINDVHDHLAEARIIYLFRAGDWKSKGKVTLGQAGKVPEQWQYLTGHDLVVIINGDAWPALSDRQKVALVDHELCHFEKTITDGGDPKWCLVSHDVEEFTGVIQRHGLWSSDVEDFVSEAQQLRLFNGSLSVVK